MAKKELATNKNTLPSSLTMSVLGTKRTVFLERLRDDGTYSARTYANGRTVRGIVRNNKRPTFVPCGTNVVFLK